MCSMHMVAYWLLIVGGLNWGLELFRINLVSSIFGSVPILVTIIYAAIGLSALAMLFKGSCKMCKM